MVRSIYLGGLINCFPMIKKGSFPYCKIMKKNPFSKENKRHRVACFHWRWGFQSISCVLCVEFLSTNLFSKLHVKLEKSVYL